MRIAIGLEYDGSGYCGWQRQSHAPSVQAEVEAAVGRVADHAVQVVCAGRTDTGVHALGQVAHFDTGAERTPRQWVLGTNSQLPGDVSVLWAQPVGPDFHARFSACARRYRYVILNRPVRPALERHRVCWHRRPLDEGRMASAARALEGEHDFSAYRAVACQARHAVRIVHVLSVAREGAYVTIDVTASGFLHHMVRNIAGVLMAIGEGAREPAWAEEVLTQRDRTLGGVTAPASGLYFMEVRYPVHHTLPVQQRAQARPRI
ncbi:MAG: tRNA pseudouridine(38-40) synthase TruA [Gammaproteobacteria bacterium]|nr:tRNA pseudouridine(38-40) synthase TruA [Gammaproteobacteria bacterium]